MDITTIKWPEPLLWLAQEDWKFPPEELTVRPAKIRDEACNWK